MTNVLMGPVRRDSALQGDITLTTDHKIEASAS